MPTRTYSRKTAPAGGYADPTRGDPSFTSGILTALPGRTWRTSADGSDVTLLIDGGDLTQQEDDDLTAAHTAWVTTDTARFSDRIKVTTYSNAGRQEKTEWYQTDNGDGTFSDLARDEVYTWQGSRLMSKTCNTYYQDGTSVETGSIVYATANNGEHVEKEG